MSEPAAPITLSTPVDRLSGVRAQDAAALRSLGLTNLGRLIAHIPLRHEKLEAETPIADIEPGRIVSTRGEVARARLVRGKRTRVEAVLHDGTARLDLVWFNMPYVKDKVLPGAHIWVQGEAKRFGGGIQIANPKLAVLKDSSSRPAQEEALRPIYPSSEACPSPIIERTIKANLAAALPLIEDHLDAAFRTDRALPSLADAYRSQHAPTTEDEVRASRRRLAYDELLLLQVGVALRRARLRTRLLAPPLKWNAGIEKHIRARLPFTLTSGQEQAIREIAGDLASSTPMNRLLQGDVGSGKTAVAVCAMLQAVASGHQAAIMAPTEILAEQHQRSLAALLAGSRVRLEMLTGAVTGAPRADILRRLAAGEIDILVGTHALLTESVQFKSLALAVIDEQHRFGVSQRAALRERASTDSTTPHVLVMTATPIPRSLAITLFGDLDVSIVHGLPPGRTPISTRVVPTADRADLYSSLAERAREGSQIYIVAPAIDPSDQPSPGPTLRSVTQLADELSSGPFAGITLAALHGRMDRDQRDDVMQSFRADRTRILIATTVIEVGVDVPNASIMVVENAERFGLAQLHQLRGRVGRGSKSSFCYLIADPATPDAFERLRALETLSDGFAIAEKDFELRGPGDLFSTRQSGLPPLRVADLSADRDLLLLARTDAATWVARSPNLDRPPDALLRRRLLKAAGPHLGLADVG